MGKKLTQIDPEVTNILMLQSLKVTIYIFMQWYVLIVLCSPVSDARLNIFARLIIFHLVGQTRVFARPIMAPRPYGWHHYISTWNVVFPRFNKNLKWQYRFAKTEETLYVAYLVSFHAEHSTTPVTLLLHPSLSLSWEQPAASRG